MGSPKTPDAETRISAPASVSKADRLEDLPGVVSGRQAETFISYSANFEDVILHRIFANQPPGFFIDVGAAHPMFENDTKLLYDSGWSGINVEPNKTFFDLLVKERTRDTNLNLALSDRAGTTNYYEVVGTGLSTCNNSFAERAEAQGYDVIPRTIEVSTLSAILDRMRPASIQLLKVDVEGLEERVLAGNDWTKYRPCVILVEATYPETPTRRDSGIKEYLESNSYRWRYFDGLNDFYVADEFDIAKDAFERPPNVFDGFKLREVVSLNRELLTARAENENLALDLADEKAERYRLATGAEQLRQDIIAYSRELKAAHLESEELLRVKLMNQRLHERLDETEGQRLQKQEQLLAMQGQLLEVREQLLGSQLTAATRTQELLRADAAHRLILSSTSWRFSSPIRVVGRLRDRLRRHLFR